MIFTDIEKAIAYGINALCDKAHRDAVQNGWWEEGNEPTPGESIALIHSELSEALEEIRNRKPNEYYMRGAIEETDMGTWNPTLKTEGIAVELADAIIRICDMCGYYDIPLGNVLVRKMQHNRLRGYRHGGKAL